MKDFQFNFPQPQTEHVARPRGRPKRPVDQLAPPRPQGSELADRPDYRKNPEGRKMQIQNLWERHHKIKRLLFLGWTHKDIATEMGMTKEAISYIANSEVMLRELELMRGAADTKALDVRAQIDENARKAAVLLHEFMTNEENEPSLRARIAMDQLSRAGYAPQVSIKGNINHTHFTLTEIEEIKRIALAENGLSPDQESESDSSIDVPFEQVN